MGYRFYTKLSQKPHRGERFTRQTNTYALALCIPYALSLCLPFVRLERCNDVLERQISILRLSLEQQKRSQSVAEIKIRNMERAKADADQRNSRLQKEMDLFFQMYGQIEKREDEDDKRRGGMRQRVLQSL